MHMSHSVGVRVVAGEEGVMTQGSKAGAARGQSAARLGRELQLVAFAPPPLARGHLGCGV